MRIFDEKVKKHILQYIFQCLLATITIILILTFLDVLTHTAIIATLGATAFIVFTMPLSYSSGPRPLIGSYAVGVIVGILCHHLSILNPVMAVTTSYVIFGALAVGIAIFVMVITNTEHPPAAGIALGLVLNSWDYRTIGFIILAVILMYGVRRLLRPILIDLI